jgi:hypothetical protein
VDSFAVLPVWRFFLRQGQLVRLRSPSLQTLLPGGRTMTNLWWTGPYISKIRGTADRSTARRDRSASPDFLSKVVASVNCIWFLFEENHKSGAGESCEAGGRGTLLMTKERVGASSGNWFEVSPFDFAEGTSFVFSLLGMTKERVTFLRAPRPVYSP